MTYKVVLRSLMEVFPQIDLRILKSVAIEFARDADAAVEFILSEVLPVISQSVGTSFTPDVFHDTEDSFDEGSTAKGQVDAITLITEKVSDESTQSEEPLVSVKENDEVSTDTKSEVSDSTIPENHIGVSGILERHISQAESGKEILASQFDSVVKMLKDTEHHEDMARKAEEEVPFAGKDMMKKWEELHQKARDVYEANIEKAKEVEGEKLVLLAKAQEIHDQLHYVTDRRDNCLSMIEEIGQILDARLTAAKTRETNASCRKLEKEKMAREAVEEKENLVKNLWLESIRLEEEAAQTAKLKDSIEFHGHMADCLKREIDLYFNDVKFLKGRVSMPTQLEESLAPSEENLSSKSVSQSLISTNSVAIVQDPQTEYLQDNADSTNVIQSLENPFVMSAPSNLSTSTGSVDDSTSTKSVDRSITVDVQTTLASADSGNASDLLEKLDVSSKSELVASPTSVAKSANSDDDWEIFSESELHES